jgi:hypothetical protein
MKKTTLFIIVILTQISILSASDKPLETIKYKQIVGLFGGVAWQTNVGKFAPAIEGIYEWKMVKNFGAGITANFTFAKNTEFAFSMPLYFHFHPNLVFWAAYGVNFTSTIPYGYSFPEEVTQTTEKKRTGNFFLRFGGGWDFEMTEGDPKMIFCPLINFDLLNVQTLYMSLGVNIKFKFRSS